MQLACSESQGAANGCGRMSLGLWILRSQSAQYAVNKTVEWVLTSRERIGK